MGKPRYRETEPLGDEPDGTGGAPKTFAVSVTGAPTIDGLGSEATMVVVLSVDWTIWVNTGDVEFEKFWSVLANAAVILWVPPTRYVEGVHITLDEPSDPLGRVTFVQIGVDPSKKVTVPVGLLGEPEPADTVAV
jgi:hypothetical protein